MKMPNKLAISFTTMGVFWNGGSTSRTKLCSKSFYLLLQICVEGSHAIGKSEFAKGLAEELGMVYVNKPQMDDIIINSYGYDMVYWVVPETNC